MTFFIAEICSNHLNNIQRSKKLIDEAKRIGCDAVKFQLFKSDKLFAPEILKKSKSHRKIKSLELSQKLIPILNRKSKRLSHQYLRRAGYFKVSWRETWVKNKRIKLAIHL